MTEIHCISPIDGREVARRTTATAAAIDAALESARAAQAGWRRVALTERCKLALGVMDALRAMDREVVPELALQMGRPVRYGGEFRAVEERIRTMVGLAEGALADIEPMPRGGIKRFIRHQPAGLVLVVAPWNYPFLTAVNTIIPGIIAGNAILLKHSAQTILAGERFQQAFDAAGAPDGLFQNLVLSHDDTAKILSSGSVDHVNFTGSVHGGRAIEQAAAGTFTSLGLELGGKDPGYVRADADLNHAVESLVDGAFYNSGQGCCGIERIYIHEHLYGDFIEAFVEATSKYVLGNPLDETTTLGPMAHLRFADLVRSHTKEAVAKGAKARIDPKKFPANADGTAYLAPQILTDVDHSMKVMVEETFGPVVGIMPVKSDDEAVALMNDSRYGLTASIWSSDLTAAEELGAKIETGTVFMNRCDYLDPALAWTGVKDTGRGVTLSKLGYAALTRPKSFHLRAI